MNAKHGSRSRLDLLDYGRMFAALAVMAYHYFHNGIMNGKLAGIDVIPALDQVARYGYLGVHFFFIISGYVIFFSATGKSAADFLVARCVRLFPAFWAALFITSMFAIFLGGPLTSVDLRQVAANAFMFPQWFGQAYVDGVYWTLQYEWRFYSAVFLLLLLGRQTWLEKFFVVWPWWIFSARLGGISWMPLSEGFFALFAAGALFAMISAQRKPLWMLSLAISVLLSWKFALEQAVGMEVAKGIHLEPWVVSACLAGFFVLFAILMTHRGSSVPLPGAQWAGTITYPLYLVHAHIGYMVLSHLSGAMSPVLAYGITVALVAALSLLLHWTVERQAGRWWKHIFSTTVGGTVVKFKTVVDATVFRIRQHLG